MSIPTARRIRRLGVLAAAMALVAVAAPPALADNGHGHGHGHENDYHLTVMGTTDLHGNALNWDYFKNAEYDDKAKNDVGLAKVSTLVNQVRADRGRASTLLIDAGDTIQGTPLAYYYAKVEPITSGGIHPMAAAMNAIGYDAAALGNHEFNYGIPLLRKFQSQLSFPLLSDEGAQVARAWGAWGQKTVEGRTFDGLIRSTFVVDSEGRLVSVEYNVDPNGHVGRTPSPRRPRAIRERCACPMGPEGDGERAGVRGSNGLSPLNAGPR